MSERVRCGIKPLKYPKLNKRLLDANMVRLHNSVESVVKNSIFGIWKKLVVSQRLIWAGNRSKLLFRPETIPVELLTRSGSLLVP